MVNVCKEAGLLKAVRAINNVSLQKQFSETRQPLHFAPAFQAAAKFSNTPSPSVAREFGSEYGLNML